jgi:tetratricopeptide (TPR) repeat protein
MVRCRLLGPAAAGVRKKDMPQRYPNKLEPSRIEILQQLLAQDPASVFARYGLAMEYVKSGDLGQAVSEFEALLVSNPAYSAAYFHGGQALEKLGRLDDARDYYRRGIDATRDPHARSELQAALDILGE